MIKLKRWNTQALLLHIYLLVALINVATTFDVTRIQPIADRNIRTGNKMLYEKEINESAATTQVKDQSMASTKSEDMIMDKEEQEEKEGHEEMLDVNEIPVRYDEAQLWRIYNISDNMRHEMMPVADILENKYGK